MMISHTHFGKALLLSTCLLLSSPLPAGHAQVTTNITSDGTLSTSISQAGNVYNINGGTISGSNLFQSFGIFNVGTGAIASFNGPNSIANILSRVTGGQQSLIDGTLRSTISGANLYLLNPAGVLFGPNASLNVSGSFHVSTADYLKFNNGEKFFVDPNNANTVLSVAPVAAFGFLGPNPAAITVQGSILQVPSSKTLSVVGGDITINQGAFLLAPSGQINLASVKGQPGEVLLANSQAAFGTGQIQLSQGTRVDASGDPSGTVVIRGGRLVADQATVAATQFIANGPFLAIDVRVTGDVIVSNLGSLDSFGAIGRAGSIRIDSSSFQLMSRSRIDSSSGSGQGGDVTITTSDSISIANLSTIRTNTFGTLNAGRVSLESGTFELKDGAIINASNSSLGIGGRGGDISIMARDRILVSGRSSNSSTIVLNSSTTSTTGGAGNISLSARSVEMTNGAQTSATTQGSGKGGDVTLAVGGLQMMDGAAIGTVARGSGQGGNVTITATDSVSIAGGPPIPVSSGGISTQAQGSGAAGHVSISSPVMDIRNGAHIDSVAFGGGRSGDITLTVGTLQITNGATITTLTQNAGRGGDVTIRATDSVSIAGSQIRPGFGFQLSGISTGTSGTGNAGQVSISARSVNLQDGAQINTRTSLSSGRGGDVIITATDAVSVEGGFFDNLFSLFHPSSISTSTLGSGNAGHVAIATRTLNMTGGGRINASAGEIDPLFGALGCSFFTPTCGRGGNVTVTATDRVSLGGTFTDRFGTVVGSGILTRTFAEGDAGRISVSAGSLGIAGGARIDTGTSGSGAGGIVAVAAGNLLIAGTGSGLFTDSSGSGSGGDIHVGAGNIALNDGATISARSTGLGNAGNIFITASDAFVARNSSVTTQATQADGGDIRFEVGRLFHLINSDITTKVGGGTGSGGNIFIDPILVLLDGSRIIASAIGGAGGNITIVAGLFLASPDSIINASSSLGISGSISIQAPTTNLSGTLAPLPEDFLQAAGLLRARCAARLSGKASSFVLAGRDGLPPAPGGMMPSPLYLAVSAGPAPAVRAAGAGRLNLGVSGLRTSSSRQSSNGSPAGLEQGCAG